MPTVTCQTAEHLAHVRLNRPESGNRFSMEMLRELACIFTELDADPAIRCLLLTSEGADFSLGVDVPDVLPCWAAGKSPFEDHQINPFGTTGPRRRMPLVTAGPVLQCRPRAGAGVRHRHRGRQLPLRVS